MSDSVSRVQSLRELASAFILPIKILSLSSVFFARTFVGSLVTFNFGVLFSPARFQQAWFAGFWKFFGGGSADNDAIVVRKMAALADGNVLDLGPGTGIQLKYFVPEKITKAYGIEPCIDLHPVLKQSIVDTGLEGKYEVLGCGAEELEKQGLERESFDTVVCCKVLCGVPRPESVLKELYGYLKPGGQILFYEHVLNEEHTGLRIWQRVLQCVWPVMMQGCNLTRRTGQMVKEAGEWESFEMGPPETKGRYEVIPFVLGRAVKKQ